MGLEPRPHLRRPGALAAGAAVLLQAGAGLAASSPVIEGQRAMAGTWAGDGTQLVIDTARLQANLDPERPFEWRAFRVVDVSGKMIVFDVGPMRYVALLAAPGAMTLTSPSFTGERALKLVHR